MASTRRVDVLIVSLGSTSGLRIADEELAGLLGAAGASVEIVSAKRPRELRTLMLTDLAWARAAREAAKEGIARSSPRAIVYSSTTAALLWPAPGAIRFDAPAAGNRPGRHGLWQRPLERRRLLASPLLLPYSAGALEEAGIERGGRSSLVLPLAIEPSGSIYGERDIAALTYAANPRKKGLDRVLAAWRAARERLSEMDRRELVVAGASAQQLEAVGIDLSSQPGVRDVGPLSRSDYRALLRRSQVFICAPRREDYGAAQLEALADGCLLVTTPAPGPYAALPIARQLDERLVAESLVASIGQAFAYPDRESYVRRAQQAIAPFRAAEVRRTVTQQLLPRLLDMSS